MTNHQSRLYFLQASFVLTPSLCAVARTCAWVSAMARASAASACSLPGNPSMAATMCWTWALSAAPVPTTASFISRAAYSDTGRSRSTTALIAAPRAWPSLSAESALRPTNTCSIATSCGRYSSTSPVNPCSSRFRRAAKSPSPSSTSGWWCTWRTLPAGSTSMMPTPVRCEPGSIPRMRMAGTGTRAAFMRPPPAPSGPPPVRPGPDACSAGVAQVGVRIDVLHVVQVLEHVQQLLHLLRGLAGHGDVVVGAEGHLGIARGQAGGFHGLLHRLEVLRRGDHVDRAIVRIHDHVVGTGLDRRLGHLLLVGTLVAEHAQALEHEGDRALGAHVAAALGEGVSHVGHGAHAVVGQAVDDHGDAAGGVALVAHFLVLDAFELAGGLLDRALDHVLGHVRRQCLVHRRAQARVVVRIAPAGAGGDADLADQLGENLAALGIAGVLARFDRGTTTHGVPFVLRCEATDYSRPPPSPALPADAGPNAPVRRKAATCRAASADSTSPVWLARIRQYALAPGSRVSSRATVPSESGPTADSSPPTPRGESPATTPSSALPRHGWQPHSSSGALRPSAQARARCVARKRAVALPHSGEPRQTTRRTGSSG